MSKKYVGNPNGRPKKSTLEKTIDELFPSVLKEPNEKVKKYRNEKPQTIAGDYSDFISDLEAWGKPNEP